MAEEEKKIKNEFKRYQRLWLMASHNPEIQSVIDKDVESIIHDNEQKKWWW